MFDSTLNRELRIADVSLLASAARTATGQGSAVVLGDKGTLSLVLNVGAASGTTPTLNVTVETRHDSGDAWRSAGTFAQKTAAGSERKSFAGIDREVRVSYTIGGTTPSFTFGVTGEAK